MQIGTRISDGISIRIERLEGKLFRNNATNALNKYLGAQLGRVGGYDRLCCINQFSDEFFHFVEIRQFFWQKLCRVLS